MKSNKESIPKDNNLRHKIDVASTSVGAIFGLHGKFSLHKIIQISVCAN